MNKLMGTVDEQLDKVEIEIEKIELVAELYDETVAKKPSTTVELNNLMLKAKYSKDKILKSLFEIKKTCEVVGEQIKRGP